MATDVGHRELMLELVTMNAWTTGALVGLGTCSLLARLLEGAPSLRRLVGVDHFVRRGRHRRALAIQARFPGRCEVLCCKSLEAALLIEDDSLDFVFLDAGHKYGCVRSDLRAWWPKIVTGGWLGGHDYAPEYAGLVRAVDERFRTVTRHEFAVWAVTKT